MTLFGVEIAGTGAGITTLIGLVGFAVACGLVYSLAWLKWRTRTLSELPPEKKSLVLDNLAARYNIDLRNVSEKRAVELVLREMELRFRKQMGLATLSALVFVSCFTLLWMHPGTNQPSVRTRTEADDIVLGYMKDVIALRGDYEARHINPKALDHVRTEGLKLADVLRNIDDGKLNPSRQVIKDEYAGWALLLAARTFDLADAESREERRRHAQDAVELFTTAVRKMDGIRKAQATGDKYASEDYEWMMGESADWDRTLYLRAAARAVAAQAGAPFTKEVIRSELAKVSKAFKDQYPPLNIDELKWALEDNKEEQS